MRVSENQWKFTEIQSIWQYWIFSGVLYWPRLIEFSLKLRLSLDFLVLIRLQAAMKINYCCHNSWLTYSLVKLTIITTKRCVRVHYEFHCFGFHWNKTLQPYIIFRSECLGVLVGKMQYVKAFVPILPSWARRITYVVLNGTSCSRRIHENVANRGTLRLKLLSRQTDIADFAVSPVITNCYTCIITSLWYAAKMNTSL